MANSHSKLNWNVIRKIKHGYKSHDTKWECFTHDETWLTVTGNFLYKHQIKSLDCSSNQLD